MMIFLSSITHKALKKSHTNKYTHVHWAHRHARTHTQGIGLWYAHYLHKLMPVLYGFAWIDQHGRPVLSSWTVSITADTTHPYNLIMTNTDKQRGVGNGGMDKIYREGWGRVVGEREDIKQEWERERETSTESLIYQPWVLGTAYRGWGRILNSSSQTHRVKAGCQLGERAAAQV